MRINFSRLMTAAALGALIALPACGKSTYDAPEAAPVDATSYTAWTYFDFETGRATIVEEYGENAAGTPPEKWHFAMHRYNCKTNGAGVMETGFTKIEDMIIRGGVPDGEFVEDVWTDDTVIYDMSGMQEGIIGYAETWCNLELSKWMNVDLSVMPPIYTPSDRVYVLKFADGKMAALRFTDFVGPREVKWHNSLDYIYPLEF